MGELRVALGLACSVQALHVVLGKMVLMSKKGRFATVNGPYTDELGATINEQTKTITTTASGSARFYRLVGGSPLKFKTVVVQGTQVTMTYE